MGTFPGQAGARVSRRRVMFLADPVGQRSAVSPGRVGESSTPGQLPGERGDVGRLQERRVEDSALVTQAAPAILLDRGRLGMRSRLAPVSTDPVQASSPPVLAHRADGAKFSGQRAGPRLVLADKQVNQWPPTSVSCGWEDDTDDGGR
jgi:hypothetical protein